MASPKGPLASLDLTHVLYDDDSYTSLFLALVTLTPILLMASYAALAVQTREYLIIVMWAGQFFGEGLNWVIKRIVKQERPILEIGDGYGFPSSHSQYMGYFTSFLVCHLYFRHRFASSGFPLLDQLWRICVYAALYGWAGVVAYSRYHLGYHAPHQIYWGLGIGIMLGTSLYFVAELLPSWYPKSLLGQLKKFAVTNPISTWCQIRDGWALWADGGRHSEWLHWKQGWTEQQRLLETGKTKKR